MWSKKDPVLSKKKWKYNSYKKKMIFLKGLIYAERYILNVEAVEIYTKKYGTKTPWKCGAYTPQQTTHNFCPLNKKKKNLK